MLVVLPLTVAMALVVAILWRVAERQGKQEAADFVKMIRTTSPRPDGSQLFSGADLVPIANDLKNTLENLVQELRASRISHQLESQGTHATVPILRPRLHGLHVDMNGTLSASLGSVLNRTLSNSNECVVAYGHEDILAKLAQQILPENERRYRSYTCDEVEQWLADAEVKDHTGFSDELYQKLEIEELSRRYDGVHIVSLLPTYRLRSGWVAEAYAGHMDFEKWLNRLLKSGKPAQRKLSILCGYSWADIREVAPKLEQEDFAAAVHAIVESHDSAATFVFPVDAPMIHGAKAQEYLIRASGAGKRAQR